MKLNPTLGINSRTPDKSAALWSGPPLTLSIELLITLLYRMKIR